MQAFGGNSPAQNDDNVLTDEELALYNQLLLANNYLLEPNDKKRWKCEWRLMVTRVVKFPMKAYKIRSKFGSISTLNLLISDLLQFNFSKGPTKYHKRPRMLCLVLPHRRKVHKLDIQSECQKPSESFFLRWKIWV